MRSTIRLLFGPKTVITVSLMVMFLIGLTYLALRAPWDTGGFDGVDPADLEPVVETTDADDDSTTGTANAGQILDLGALRESLDDPASCLNIAFYVLLILLPLLCLCSVTCTRMARSNDFTVQEEGGAITITEQAMRKFIRLVCVDVDGLEDIQVRVSRAGQGVKVKAAVKVRTPDVWIQVKTSLLQRIPDETMKVIGRDAISSLELVCLDLTHGKGGYGAIPGDEDTDEPEAAEAEAAEATEGDLEIVETVRGDDGDDADRPSPWSPAIPPRDDEEEGKD